MKKILLLIAFLSVLFASALFVPSLLPEKLKIQLVEYKLKDLPGKISVGRVEIDFFSQTILHDLHFEYNDLDLLIPTVKIQSPLLSMLFSKTYPLDVENSTTLYKKTQLLQNTHANASVKNVEETLLLTKPALLATTVDKAGTKAFTNHSLVPSFSAERVLLELEKGSFQKGHHGSLNMEGTLRLNTLMCSKNHLLSVILSLLQKKPKHIIPVSFNPVHFIAENGVISFGLTSFYIDDAFKLLSKGTVNLLSDSLNIHVALTSESLAKALDITDLPDGYLIPFHIKGSINKPKIDSSKAIQTIAALILLKKIDPEQRTLPKTGSF